MVGKFVFRKGQDMNFKKPFSACILMAIVSTTYAADMRELYTEIAAKQTEIASMERRIQGLIEHTNTIGANDFIQQMNMNKLISTHTEEIAKLRRTKEELFATTEQLEAKEQEVFKLNYLNQELVDHANEMNKKMQDAFEEMKKMRSQMGTSGRTPASVNTTVAGNSTYSIADLFKDGKLDIDPREKRELKEFIGAFMQAHIKDLNHNKKISLVTFTKPENASKDYAKNLTQSMQEGMSLASYIMSDEFGEFPYKEQFVSSLQVSGVAATDGLTGKRAPASTSSCGIYDCFKSHRIELSIK